MNEIIYLPVTDFSLYINESREFEKVILDIGANAQSILVEIKKINDFFLAYLEKKDTS